MRWIAIIPSCGRANLPTSGSIVPLGCFDSDRDRFATSISAQADTTACNANSDIRLERNPQRELHDARHVSARRVHEIRGVHVGIHSGPLCVVKHVEGFRAELYRDLLRGLEDLVNRHIEVCSPRIVQAIASGIAEGQPLRLDVCCTVEQRYSLRSVSQGRAIRRRERIADLVCVRTDAGGSIGHTRAITVHTIDHGKGVPVWKVIIPAYCQPPSAALANPFP